MSEMPPRPKSVKAMSGSKLKLVWRDGEARVCDLTGLIARSNALAPLAASAIFGKAKIVDWGAGVGWPNGLDLSNQEAADALGLTLGTIKNYRKGQVIPPAAAVACRAMMNDPHVMASHFRPRKPGRPLVAA